MAIVTVCVQTVPEHNITMYIYICTQISLHIVHLAVVIINVIGIGAVLTDER